MLLADKRKALAAICAPSDFESPALFAAKELRFYLGRITGAVFELTSEPREGCIRVCVDGKEDNPDRLRISVSGSGMLLTGGCRGVIYAVYELLEQLGCRFFTRTAEKVPVIPHLEIPDMEFTSAPAFEYREHNYADVTQYPRFAVKRRLNGSHHPIPARLGGNMPYAWFVHSFENICSAEEYGESHPEYFSEINGKRVTTTGGRTQLCLTNPDVLALGIEKTRAALRANPAARIISISQNDWQGGCECAACRRINEEEGSPAGTLLRFVNTIAETLEGEFPDVIFDTLAYQYTRSAPRITRNRKNVCVRICSIESCFCHPFGACTSELPREGMGRFIDDLNGWAKVCNRMYIWDYTTCFAHYPMPFPNWRVLKPNINIMRENNVRGVFEQACGASRGSTDFNELRLYLLSRLMWNPDCDIEADRREFMEFYYGAAAQPLMSYMDDMCDYVEQHDIHVHFNDEPTGEYLSEERLDVYDRYFEEALNAVRGDALRLSRVEKARLSLRWVRIKRATMLNGDYDLNAIEDFTRDWRAFGMSRIDEWFNLENTHRALLDGHWRARVYFDHWTGEEPELL